VKKSSVYRPANALGGITTSKNKKSISFAAPPPHHNGLALAGTKIFVAIHLTSQFLIVN
jgi:hypothetical protein